MLQRGDENTKNFSKVLYQNNGAIGYGAGAMISLTYLLPCKMPIASYIQNTAILNTNEATL